MIPYWYLLIALLMHPAKAPKLEARPNILFIVSEDNGPDMGCYGAPVNTPNLDQLAEKGTLFELAFVPQAGCSQSRASFLTGLYPHQHGQIGLATWKYQMYFADIPNVVTSLKEAGYATGIIGKLHVNPESAFPFDWAPQAKELTGSNFGRKHLDQYAVQAASFMADNDKPFYLQINYPDAHAPFTPQVDGVPAVPLVGHEVDALPYMEVSDSLLKQKTADYYNCMMRLDKYVGDLLEALDQTGKAENTLIVYIGDHGADLLRGKRTSLEGGLRIPMLIYDPRHPARIRTKAMVSTIDLYPTFLESAGLPIPHYLPGKSLVPYILGNQTSDRKYLFAEYHTHSNHNPYPQRSVRDERFKLIHNLVSGIENPGYAFTLDHTVEITEEELKRIATPVVYEAYQRMKNPPEYELYDLEKDPNELVNIAGDAAYGSTLTRLQSVLLDWQKKTQDPLIDQEVARKVFEAIMHTGVDQKQKQLVPYLELMTPKKPVWK
ncbi:MAG: sulfatase [Saprospiraceae bacterium]|nr:sulfatase [Saprospiraceae bacterium]